MDIRFLGVGEACDSRQPNTSLLLKTEQQEAAGRILLDCGFTTPHQYMALNPDPEELDVLWISHYHGDHFFGTPLLLLWLWETGRRKQLYIAGPPEVEAKISGAVELAYPNLLSRLDFPLLFIEMDGEIKKIFADAVWRTAYNEHSQPCLSLKLELQNKAVFYSGDGRPTVATGALAQGCDIIIHEAYGFDDSTPGHGSIASCLDFARKADAKKLALLHLQRNTRPQAGPVIQNYQKQFPDLQIILPEAGSVITL